MSQKARKRALITGITGQDGSYLAELLLEQGYEAHGLVMSEELADPDRRMYSIRHLRDRLALHCASLEDFLSVFKAIEAIRPDECYHLAALSSVASSFGQELLTLNVNIQGTLHVLSALKSLAPRCRFFFAASSEMFGRAAKAPQDESTPFHPRSPYGISKVAGFDLTRNYREAYDLFGVSGIMYNHESPRRGLDFVTRKITSHAAKIKLGLAQSLTLGDIDARRDWGHARDYVRAMWLMLQQDEPRDFVLATGETHSVRDFVQAAFEAAGLDYKSHLTFDRKLLRPVEESLLVGDATEARQALGWAPSVRFEDLVREMVESDLEYYRNAARV